MTDDSGRFMVAAAAVLEHDQSGDILLLRRGRDRDFAPEVWEDVSGRLHQGEHPEQALRREIEEETGITDVEIVTPIRAFHFFRGERRAEYELVGIAFWCRTKSRTVTLSGEHTEFRWLPATEALELAGHEGIRANIAAFVGLRAPRPVGPAEQREV